MDSLPVDESRPPAELEQSRSGARITLLSDREITIERMFNARPEVVFAAWTRPESVSQWWDPSGATLAVCEIDLRPGGKFRFIHTTSSGGGHAFSGTYREVSPPGLLIFATPAPSGGETVGTLRFEDCAGGTLLTLRMASASREARDTLLQFGVDKGTARTLDNLRAHLARKEVAP